MHLVYIYCGIYERERKKKACSLYSQLCNLGLFTLAIIRIHACIRIERRGDAVSLVLFLSHDRVEQRFRAPCNKHTDSDSAHANISGASSWASRLTGKVLGSDSQIRVAWLLLSVLVRLCYAVECIPQREGCGDERNLVPGRHVLLLMLDTVRGRKSPARLAWRRPSDPQKQSRTKKERKSHTTPAEAGRQADRDRLPEKRFATDRTALRKAAACGAIVTIDASPLQKVCLQALLTTQNYKSQVGKIFKHPSPDKPGFPNSSSNGDDDTDHADVLELVVLQAKRTPDLANSFHLFHSNLKTIFIT